MSTTRGRIARPLVAALAGLAFVGLGVAAATRLLDAVEVEGDSMSPALLPGDRLLVEAFSFSRRTPRVGEIVLAADPREPSRELVKRVVEVSARGELVVRGDAADRSTDSREFGPLPGDAVRWRAVLRYAPLRRIRLV